MRSADYLNVLAFPAVTCISRHIILAKETKGTMGGTLTMLGIEAPITLNFVLKANRPYPDFIPNYDEVRIVSFEATGAIDRTAFGLDFIAFPGSPTGVEIDLDIHLDLID